MTKKQTHSLLIVLTLLCSAITAFSQSVSLRVASQAVQGQRFTVSITVADGEANITRETAPKLAGCTLIAGPGVSTMHSVQIINGRQTSSVSKEYTFTYSADKAGTVNIPALKIKVDGKDLQTQPKTLTILPPDQANQRNSRGNAYGYPPSDFDELEEWMNQMMGGGSPRAPQQPQVQAQSQFSPNDFLVTVSLSKNDVYEKEALIATIKLYTKHDVTKFQPVVMPQFEGFLSEEIDVTNQQPQQEHYRGENYYSVVLKKCLLYPQKAGRLTINSGTYDVTLQTVDYVSNGYYATPVPKSHNITTKSNSVSLNVKPLPSPAPASFSGAVGSFDITSSLIPQQLRTNEAAKYILTVKGTGNIKHLAEPIVPFPATVEEYTPTGEAQARFNGSNMEGTYTVTYTFVPQQTGKLTIPSWQYTYFNPATGKYVTVTLPAMERDVAKGIAGNAPAANQTMDTGNIRDIRHIVDVDESGLTLSHSTIFDSVWYWLAYLLSLAALISAILIYRKHIKSMADIQGRKIRKARSVAAKRLQKARAAMARHNGDEFYAALSAALWGFLSDKLKMPASSLTRDNIADTLTDAGADRETIGSTIRLLDECEMARFTPQHSDSEMSTLYADASAIIDTLNKLKPAQAKKEIRPVQSRYGV